MSPFRSTAGLVTFLVSVVTVVAVVGLLWKGLGSGSADGSAVVPDLVGQTVEEAEEALRAEGFEVIAETRESPIEEDGKVVEQEPSSGGEARDGSAITLTVGEGPVEAPSGYDLVRDDSGNLSVEVPSSWSERLIDEEGTFTGERADEGEGIGPAITAATDLYAFENDASSETPGLFVVASRKLARQYTEDQLVGSGFNYRPGCEAGVPQDFSRSRYSGQWQSWSCPTNGATYFTLAAAPEGRECAVMLQVATYGKEDEEHARHIMDTWQVDCEGLP